MDLKEKVAIVTGGASGIGLAIVQSFHAAGAKVLIADIDPDAGQRLADSLGESALFVQTDITSDSAVMALIEHCCRAFGGVDVLCNNAGIDGSMSPLDKYTVENFERVMAVNVRGTFLCTKHVLPVMISRGGGNIINIASNSGLVAVPGLSIYGASKAAVIHLTKSVAVEYAAQGIRANVIAPGMTETPLVVNLMETNKEDAERVLAMTPMGRIGRPKEVGQVALFLASEQASYMTGVVLPVDGAYSIL